MKPLNIIFMGTPQFAAGVLETIISGSHRVMGVITASDKPSGRGRKLNQSAVKIVAQNHNLCIWQPKNLKDQTFIDELHTQKPDLFVVVAFRMLPEVLWRIPKFGTFNLHASLLPQYRGAAPINWAIINGETQTGVTTFFIDQNIDTGAIIDQMACNIGPKETASGLHDKLQALGKELVEKTLDDIAQQTIAPKAQIQSETLKVAPKLDAHNTRINWRQTAAEIERLVRGLNAYPGAWTLWPSPKGEQKVKIYSTAMTTNTSSEPGKLVWDKKNLWVHTADTLLAITELQFPGKKKMRAQDLLNGFNFDSSDKFV